MASHHGGNVGFKATVLATHTNCLTRLIDESLRIEEGEKRYGLANSKSEWGAGSLVRWRVDGDNRSRGNRQTNIVPGD